jgi:hypothetical protein
MMINDDDDISAQPVLSERHTVCQKFAGTLEGLPNATALWCVASGGWMENDREPSDTDSSTAGYSRQ